MLGTQFRPPRSRLLDNLQEGGLTDRLLLRITYEHGDFATVSVANPKAQGHNSPITEVPFMKRVVLLLLLVCNFVAAATGQRSGSVDVRLSSSSQQTEGVLIRCQGNVEMTTDSIVLRADEVDYHSDTGIAEARGNVRLQLLQATQNPWVNIEVVEGALEGARYKVREVMFLGVNAVPSEQVLSLSQIHPEDILDTSEVRETLESVRRLYAAIGYPTASIVPQVRIHEAGHWVSLRFTVIEGAQQP